LIAFPLVRERRDISLGFQVANRRKRTFLFPHVKPSSGSLLLSSFVPTCTTNGGFLNPFPFPVEDASQRGQNGFQITFFFSRPFLPDAPPLSLSSVGKREKFTLSQAAFRYQRIDG